MIEKRKKKKVKQKLHSGQEAATMVTFRPCKHHGTAGLCRANRTNRECFDVVKNILVYDCRLALLPGTCMKCGYDILLYCYVCTRYVRSTRDVLGCAFSLHV